MGTENIV